MGDTLAAIDIGTNSVHLVVARFVAAERFEVVAREKEMARLGSGAGDMKHLSPAAMDRAVAALHRFRQVAEISGAPVRAVATSAVREATNAHTFLERARREAGVEVEVISGVEEARLIHLGVLQALPVFDKRLLLVDIGGGSTEVLVGLRGETLAGRSLKLGAIRLTRRFFASNRLHPGAVDACRRHVRSELVAAARDVQAHGFDVAAGSSGTVGAVVEMARAATGDPRPRTFNGYEVTRDEIGQVVERLLAAPTVARRARIPGLDPRRADIILAGALVLEQVVEACGIGALTYSDYALREGVLLDARERHGGASRHHLHDLRRRSVLHLAELCDDDPGHSAQVARLALRLFDLTRGRHGLGDEARELLEAAALLANVGLFVSHAGHHKHSYYVIRNSEHLAGYTDREIELIALVARYHRKSAPKAKHAEFAALRPEDQAMVTVLAGLLRVAIGLDRNHDGRVVEVACDAGGDRLVVSAAGRDRADLSLEVYSAAARKELLEAALGAEIAIVSG
jgi:exopolyphosphatase/guanosine-5'-triphosphate,3'-diphosphate pyrophosphatase